jgi:hypothetical protein
MTWRERRAYHEGGHCAACIVFGIPIISVSITGDVPHMLRSRWHAPDGIIGVEAMTTLCLAGPAAEEFFCGKIEDGSDRIDYQMARGYLARRFDPLRVELEIGRARAGARRLIIDQEQRIRAIANALLQHGTLTGDEIGVMIASDA